MGKRGRTKKCDFCQDEDADVECATCDVTWHSECALGVAKDAATTERAIKAGTWECEECERDNRNDANCGRCGKEEGATKHDSLLLCDGCPASYHMACVGLKEEPVDDEWFCPKCAEKRAAKARLAAAPAKAEGEADETQDFCEVCQEGGRLLSCEVCPKAYHPSCIQQYLKPEQFVEEDFEWKCPVCEGHSLLQRAQVVEYAESELKRRHAERNKQNKKKFNEVKARRNQFIRQHLDLIKPFLSNAFLKDIKVVHPKDVELVDVFGPAEAAGTPLRLLSEGNELKAYQKEAVNHLISAYSQLSGYIMGLPMGAGKTVIALSFIAYIKQFSLSPGPHLVIVPLSTVGNWQREANRFVPQLTVGKLCGSASEREFMLNKNDFWYGERDVYITTYETLINTENFFTNIHWGSIIMDEAHRIKRAGSRLKEALSHLSSVCRVMLSGTPLQNNLLELGELLNALWPDVISNMKPFETAMADGKVQNKTILTHIKDLLNKLMMYRKKDILSLPEKITHTVWLPMTPQIHRLYKTLLDRKRALQTEEPGQELMGARKLLKLMSQLRLLCCHPGAVLHHRHVTDILDPATVQAESADLKFGPTHLAASNKLVFVDKILLTLDKLNKSLWNCSNVNSASPLAVNLAAPLAVNLGAPLAVNLVATSAVNLGAPSAVNATTSTSTSILESELSSNMGGRSNKVLIFSQFTRTLNEVENYLKWRGFSYMRMDGSTSRVVRELDMRDFNAPEDRTLVYLISTRSGGLGINLQASNHVFVYDSDFNPHVDEQAIARAWRLGSVRKVFVWKLMTEWSVEERIMVRQQMKLELERHIIRSHQQAVDDDDPNATEDELDDVPTTTRTVGLVGPARPVGRRGRPSTSGRLSEEEEQEEEGKPKHISSDELFGKLTAAEMNRMIDHGYAAITMLTGEALDANTSLDELVARKRLELEIDEVSSDGGSSEEVVDAVDDEEIPTPVESMAVQASSGAQESPEGDVGDFGEPLSKRIRKAPQFFQQEFNYDLREGWVPGGAGGSGTKKSPLFHEHTCFMCAEGGELIECGACPKVYHLDCQHLEEVPKGRWTCSWHECWDCYRKQSQVGELIHCVNCPRAFCLDCFPQSFRRTTPEPSFWQGLKRMGYEANASNFIVFTCNDCRVFLEQEKRKQLAKEEHERQTQLKQQQALKEKLALQASLGAKAKAMVAAQARAMQVASTGANSVPLFPDFAAAPKPKSKPKAPRAPASSAIAGLAPPAMDLYRLYFTAQETVRMAFDSLVPAELEQQFKAEAVSVSASGATTELLRTRLALLSDGDLVAEANSKNLVVKPDTNVSELIEAIISKSLATSSPGGRMNKQFAVPCGNCRLPGHLSHLCPYPGERLAGPRSNMCPKCRCNHQRLCCQALTVPEIEEYKLRAKTFLNISQAVRQRAPLLTPEERKLPYVQMRNLISLRIDRVLHELSSALFQHRRPSASDPSGATVQAEAAAKAGEAAKAAGGLVVPGGLRTLQKTQPEKMEAQVGPVVLLRCASDAALEAEDPAVKTALEILKFNETRVRRLVDHGIRARAEGFTNNQ